ncbi:MAG TPA: phosphoribosylanthranilate isomerase [Candidatus Sulfotelmatobacter sp.]|nr:phosphoribosylanthranilate isomerase [Candidatus Sulfotelmatobacter sp.]
MTWVKICGMTNLEDALVAVDAGADAVGFVFYEKSPRCVSVETAREIVEKLPENVEKVGVFVDDESTDHWSKVVPSTRLTAVQQYISLEPHVQPHRVAVGRALFPNLKFFTAFPILRFLEAGASPEELGANFEHLREGLPMPPPEGMLETFVLDSGGSKSPGGTGRTFDWAWTVPIAEGMRRGGLKLIVAGGLTPDNVGEAMRVLKPWGVDVVSGVEERPGKKDPEKVRAFVRAVREIDRKVS